jgi:hypothetical protein
MLVPRLISGVNISYQAATLRKLVSPDIFSYTTGDIKHSLTFGEGNQRGKPV